MERPYRTVTLIHYTIIFIYTWQKDEQITHEHEMYIIIKCHIIYKHVTHDFYHTFTILKTRVLTLDPNNIK